MHVSTAYVAGARKGTVPERSLDHNVDWRTELAAARAARESVEWDSRRPAVLRQALARPARSTASPAPSRPRPPPRPPARSGSTSNWSSTAGCAAQSLGWPDVYTFTKALGERVAEELLTGDLPLSVVRPAIVESALRHPYPGWIDGYKMADPLIIAFGRGILPEFPGLPDGVLDVIPVDIVVNATLAAAAAPPPVDEPAYFHVGSGLAKPADLPRHVRNVREYFTDHPMPDGGRGQIKVPTWEFPGARRVGRMLRNGERALTVAQRALLAGAVHQAHPALAGRPHPGAGPPRVPQEVRRPVRRLHRGRGHLHRQPAARVAPLAAARAGRRARVRRRRDRLGALPAGGALPGDHRDRAPRHAAAGGAAAPACRRSRSTPTAAPSRSSTSRARSSRPT